MILNQIETHLHLTSKALFDARLVLDAALSRGLLAEDAKIQRQASMSVEDIDRAIASHLAIMRVRTP